MGRGIGYHIPVMDDPVTYEIEARLSARRGVAGQSAGALTRSSASPPDYRLIPRTRYQGSKRKLCPWLAERFAELSFETALDAFGGTGSVAYLLKSMGKRVTTNDVLRANQQIGIALVENDRVRLADRSIERVLRVDRRRRYPTFIQDTFAGIYFTDEENAWLDRVCTNIPLLANRFERATAWYAVMQAALAKRPYNLFHRKNLYMRTADVERSFGNKRSWDRPFEDHFRKFAAEANAAIIDGPGSGRAISRDIGEIPGEYDLVYLDPPYINRRGVGVDYASFYHFLEGLVDYANWPERVDFKSKHRRMHVTPSPWTDPTRIAGAMDELLGRFPRSILAVSYRSNGTPTISELTRILRRHRSRVRKHEQGRYQYALSTQRETREVLFIAED